MLAIAAQPLCTLRGDIVRSVREGIVTDRLGHAAGVRRLVCARTKRRFCNRGVLLWRERSAPPETGGLILRVRDRDTDDDTVQAPMGAPEKPHTSPVGPWEPGGAEGDGTSKFSSTALFATELFHKLRATGGLSGNPSEDVVEGSDTSRQDTTLPVNVDAYMDACLWSASVLEHVTTETYDDSWERYVDALIVEHSSNGVSEKTLSNMEHAAMNLVGMFTMVLELQDQDYQVLLRTPNLPWNVGGQRRATLQTRYNFFRNYHQTLADGHPAMSNIVLLYLYLELGVRQETKQIATQALHKLERIVIRLTPMNPNKWDTSEDDVSLAQRRTIENCLRRLALRMGSVPSSNDSSGWRDLDASNPSMIYPRLALCALEIDRMALECAPAE